MSTMTTPTTYTPDDLLQMPAGKYCELINGKLVDRSVSAWSSYVTGSLLRRLHQLCEEKGLGWVLSRGASYRCFPDDPNRVRRADVSFIRRERFSPEQIMEEGHTTVAPDLVVEVISPKDLYHEVDEKVGQWLAAGVRLLWIVSPRTRQIRILRANGSSGNVTANEKLSGEDVVLGFRCRVDDLFQPPPEPKPNPENR